MEKIPVTPNLDLGASHFAFDKGHLPVRYYLLQDRSLRVCKGFVAKNADTSRTSAPG